MAILQATNCNRTYAAYLKSMAGDFDSDVIDFVDMPIGSVQILWAGGTGTPNGQVKLYASNFPDLSTFDPTGTEIDGAVMTLDAASGSRIWLRDRLAFRYLLARYTANGATGGAISIMALGKKS